LGNLLTQTDARGCVTTLEYDDLNRLQEKSYSDCPESVAATSTVTYGYDYGTYGAGFRTSMSDGSGTNPTRWEYDTRGRLAQETKYIGSSPFVTAWEYNSADLPITMTYPDDEEVTFHYDSRALLDSVSGTDTYISDTQYDSAGRAKSRTLGNGLTQKFIFNPWDVDGGRLDKIVAGSGTWNDTTKLFATTLQKLSYSYDDVGNITQIDQVINFSTNEVETQSFGYDAIYRLTSWTLNSVTKSYQYDSSTGNLSNKAGMSLQYNDANHIHAVTDANSNSYGYDDNGNQTNRAIGNDDFDLSYDAENRLTSVKKNDVTIAAFTYDGEGRRVKSVVDGETILFVGGYFELNDTTDQVTKYYPGGAIRKYIVPQTTTLNYMLGDHLGSTSLATDASGNLLVETRYTPWGEVRYTTPNQTLPTRHTFTGQYSYVSDDATDLGAAGFGLMFYNARWYDNTTGRFAQADTIVPGGMQGLDRYAYVSNSPVMYTDPSGHKCIGGPNGNDPKGGDCEDWVKKPAGREPKPKPQPGVILIFCGITEDCTDLYPDLEATLLAQFPGYTIVIVPWTGSNESQAELADQKIKEQGLSGLPVVVVGFSAGADTALIYADNKTSAGHKPVSVILIDPTCGRPGENCTTQINRLRDAGVPVLVIDGTNVKVGDGIDVYEPPSGNPVPIDPARNSGCYEVDQFLGPAHTDMPNNFQTQLAITNFFSHCSP
jgi:RHS repeat-associated protein